MSRVLLIGGTGTISRHTLAALIEAGNEPILVNRGQHGRPAVEGTPVVTVDRNDAAALQAAVDTARPDVIVDFACFTPEQANAIVRIAHGRISHLVFVSTVDAFGFPQPVLPIPEDAAMLPPRGDYAARKQACEAIFNAAHDPARLPVTIVRPTYSLGPNFVISFFSHIATGMMARIRHGRPVIVPGDGTTLIHASDAGDTGRMIAHLCDRSIAHGQTFTVGTAGSFMTHAAYAGRIADALGRTVEIVPIPVTTLLADPEPKIRDGILEKLTRFDLAFAFDAFREAFPDFQWRGEIASGIASYVARLDAEGALDLPPPEDFEDRLIADHRKSHFNS